MTNENFNTFDDEVKQQKVHETNRFKFESHVNYEILGNGRYGGSFRYVPVSIRNVYLPEQEAFEKDLAMVVLHFGSLPTSVQSSFEFSKDAKEQIQSPEVKLLGP